MSVLIAFFAILVAFSPVFPAQADVFKCTPETFTLEKTEEGLRLQGGLETPTPGYSYVVDADILRLTAPEGMAPQVISEVKIDHLFAKQDMTELHLRIEKTFDWGHDQVTCRIVG